MANYCWNKITATATNSEWREIFTAFKNDRIDWPISLEGTTCEEFQKEINCTTKWSPTPWNEGRMADLSESYPSVQFYYYATYEGGERPDSTWFCNGEETTKTGAEGNRKQAYKDEVQRFASATDRTADGISHRVEIMPDGRVAADGENRFGECEILSWMNVKQISCGNWHTVGLCKDGRVLACGSNANGQCNVSNIQGKVTSVSCGRYHTAILLDSGKVIILGNLEQEATASNTQTEAELTPSDFPLVCNLKLDKYITGWEKMNDRIELMSEGDELTLMKVNRDGEVYFEVLNTRGEKIGELWTEYNRSLSRMLSHVRVFVDTVTPLSSRRKGSKYAAMTIRLEYISSDSTEKQKPNTTLGAYIQTRVSDWPSVTRIKSVYDAVIGATDSGDIYVDGFCPCSEKDIRDFIGISRP